MLITVSGMVGSGKSTVVQHVVAALEHNGIVADLQRLQWLTSLKGKGAASPAQPRRFTGPRGSRRSGYRRQRLTVWRAIGYMGRIAIFRASRMRRRAQAIVLNRYFYDSFVHYRLESRGERVLAALLARFVPKPDVAILLVASLDTIKARRPSYSADYLRIMYDGYADLEARFPNLVRICTDAPKSAVGDAINTLFDSSNQTQAMKNRV